MRRSWLALPVLVVCAPACGDDAAPRPMPPAVLVAEAPDRITAFAVDDDFVYWGDSAGGETWNGARVLRAPRAGGAPEVLATGGTVVSELLSGAETLYWADGDGSFSCMRLHAMDKATGAITDLGDAMPMSCRFRPLAERDGKLVVLGDDPSDGTAFGQLYLVDPGTGSVDLATRFGGSIDPEAGFELDGGTAYLGHREGDALHVLRADTAAGGQGPSFDWDLASAFRFIMTDAHLYWVDTGTADHHDLHQLSVNGFHEEDGAIASFDASVGTTLFADGDFLWLDGGATDDATTTLVRVARATGASERFESPLTPAATVVRPEGFYLVVDNRIYLQERP